jgi:hypothetical protein
MRCARFPDSWPLLAGASGRCGLRVSGFAEPDIALEDHRRPAASKCSLAQVAYRSDQRARRRRLLTITISHVRHSAGRTGVSFSSRVMLVTLRTGSRPCISTTTARSRVADDCGISHRAEDLARSPGQADRQVQAHSGQLRPWSRRSSWHARMIAAGLDDAATDETGRVSGTSGSAWEGRCN